MKQFKKQKETGFTRFICTMLQINGKFYCYKPIMIFFFIVGMSQPIFYLYFSDYSELQGSLGVLKIDSIILYIIRPDILIFQYLTYLALEIIPYIIILLILLVKFGILINMENSDSRYSGILKGKGLIKQLLTKITSYYQQLLVVVFHYPIQTLIICSISNALKKFQDQNQGYFALLIFGTIIFCIIEIETLTLIFVCKQSTTLQIIAFEKFTITSFDVFLYVLQISQIILFGTLPAQFESNYIQTVLTLSISLLQIINQLKNQGYIFWYQRSLLYLVNSMILVYCCYSLIDLKNNAIILWPIVASLIFYVDYEYQMNSIFSIFIKKKNSLSHYVYHLIKFSNNCYQTEIEIIQQSLIWGQHKIKCSDVTCVCKDLILDVLDAKQANIITERMFKRFIYSKIKHLTKYIYDYNTGRYIDPSFYEITRATLFMRQGFVLMAVKNYNKLLSLQSNDYRVRQVSSEKSLSNKMNLNNKGSRKSQVDSQIQEIIQNQQKKTQKSEGFINQIHLSSFNIIKIKFLLRKAQKCLNVNFGNKINTPQEILMSDYIFNYLMHEFEMNEFTQVIMNIMKFKLELYYYLLQCENIVADRIFNSLIKCFTQIINLESDLIQKYEIFPSNKMKQLVIFFYSKIYNSHLKALKFQQINNNQQHKYVYKNQQIDFYSEKVSYILLQLQDDLQNLRIKSFSNNFLKIIGKQQNDHQNIQFQDLLPEFIKEEHPILVQRFIQTGKARFYRSLSLTFIQQNNGLVKQMEQSFDTVTLLNDNRVIFGAVIQDVVDQKAYLLVNVNGLLSGMTFTCLRRLGFSSEDIFGVNDFYMFYDVDISQLIPKFNSLLKNDVLEQKFDNLKFSFIDINAYLMNTYSKTTINISSQPGRIWHENKFMREYLVNIFVMKREIFGFSYYIIEIESANLLDTSHNNGYSISQYKNTQMMGESAIFDVESLMLSMDEGAAKHIHNLNIQERENYSVHMQTNKDDKDIIYKQQDFEKVYQVMLSPNQNNSISQLIDKSQNNIMSMQRHNSSFQQEFFCQQPANHMGEISSKELFSQRVLIKNPEEQNNIQEQSESSLETTKKPIFIKKFQIIQQFYNTFNFQQQQMYVSFIIFTFITFSIFSILILSILSTDLTSKIQEIEMLSLQANIVAPYDRYLGIRAQIYYYNQLYSFGTISKAYLAEINEPLYAMVPPSFNELKQNAYTSLLDNNLIEFFKDVYTNTFFMGKTDTVIYSRNITFREFIHQMLNSQYQFKIIFDYRGTTKGLPCQVFQFANYFNLQDNLQTMSLEILNFSQTKCNQIIDKWVSIWIGFIVVCFILSMLVFYLKTLILYQYDTILEVISHISEQSLQKEVEKQKQILSSLQQSQNDYINCYLLRLQSEGQVNSKAENDITRKTKRKSLVKTSKIKSILFSTIIFGIFLIYSCLVTFSTENFLNQYQETASFYKLIADLSFRTGGIFVYREVFMLWANLTYLNRSDGLRLYNLINTAEDIILEYLDTAPRINLNSLLVPPSFYDYFVQVQNNDVCQFLDQNYTQTLDPYCPKAFDGALLKGMLQTLTYIRQSIINQQAINNFTKRAENVYFEVEGGQIVSQVFTHMNDQLRAGIITKTQTFTSQNQLLSIIFLVGLASLSFYIIGFYLQSIKTHLQLIKFGVLLIPQLDILKNDFFERFLKQIELKLGYKL